MKWNTYETNVVHANYSDDGELQSVIKAFKKKPDLTGHFLVPKWLLVLGVLMATSILITLMASIFVVVLAPRPGLINESCAQRSCLKDLNLKCINKTCQCSAGYFYTNKCILTKNYMESCHLIVIIHNIGMGKRVPIETRMVKHVQLTINVLLIYI